MNPQVADSLRRLQPQLDDLLATADAPAAALREDLAVVPVLASLAPGQDALVLSAVRYLTTHRTGADRAVLHEVAPHLAPWLRADPAGCLEQVSSAARAVDHRPGALRGWTTRIVAAAAHVGTADELRALGVLAAWRSGLVRMRAAALALGPSLPPAALSVVLDVPDGPAALAANAADPWAWPAWGPGPGQLRVVARCGGFVGFGGPYAVPPVALAGDGHRWHVRAGGTEHLLLWDVHGDAVLPPDQSLPAQPPLDLLDERGVLHLAGLSAPAPWSDVLTGSAVAGRNALLSRAGSHLLDLLRVGA